MLPLFVLVLAIGSGARAFAGEEDAGRLELVLSYPVRRSRAVLAKGAAIAVEVAVVCAVILAALALLDPVFGLDLGAGKSASALLGLAVVGILHGWLALAVGTAVPSRGSLSASRRHSPRAATSSAACTSSRAGSTPSAFSPRSGGSARRRSRTARGDGACSSSPPPRSSSWPPPRCSSSGATSRCPRAQPPIATATVPCSASAAWAAARRASGTR